MRRLALLLACASAAACAGDTPDRSPHERLAGPGLAGPRRNVSGSSEVQPRATDRVLMDTRASLQTASSLKEALGPFDGGTGGNVAFTTNFDGRGTRALTLPWDGAHGCEGSEQKLLIRQMPLPKPRELYVQWKSWLGRTATGGGVGSVGVFDIARPSCARSGADRLRVLRDVPDGGAMGAVKLEWVGPEPGTQRVVREPRFSGDGSDYTIENTTSRFLPEQNTNAVITTTVHLKASSSPDAADGVLTVWQNGVVRVQRGNLRLGATAFDRVQLPESLRGAEVAMTEYLWDVVMWEPQAASASGSGIATVAGIRIDPRDLTLAPQGTAQVTATPVDQQGNALSGRTVTWRSANSTVATITAAGLITAVASGATYLVATVDGVSDSAKVSVPQLTATTSTSASSGTSTSTSTSSTTSSPMSTSTSTASVVGVAAGTLLRDDFLRYASTADLKAQFGWGKLYSFPSTPELIFVDGNVRYNGHATMRYDQPGGSRSTPSLMPYLPRAVNSFWYRAKIRFSPGWSTTGVEGTGAEAYKIFGWGWKGYEDRGGLDYSNLNDYQLYWGVKPIGGTDVYPFVEGPGIRIVGAGKANVAPNAEWSDGQWYDYIVHWQKIGPMSGRATLWIAKDGQAPVRRGTVAGTLLQGQVPQVERISLGMNFNRVRNATQSQSMWYGQWEVIDGALNANPFGVVLP